MVKKVLFLFLVSIITISCKKEKQEPNKEIPKETQKVAKVKTYDDTGKDFTIAPIDFLDEKYKTKGFVLPDHEPSFPNYTYFDKSLGGFSVNYIGKSALIQYKWSRDYSTGYFSQFKDLGVEGENNKAKQISEIVTKILKRESKDYYIIADFLPKEAIQEYLNDGSGEFELKENAQTYFYVYENNKWVFIKKLPTLKIKKEGVALYKDLLLFHKLKNIKPIAEKFQGKFRAEVDGEVTMNETGHTTYYFTITENQIDLKSEAFRGDFVCEGNYKGIQEDNILELYYDRNDQRCIKLEATYSIKKEGDNFFIKGIGGEVRANDWIKMYKE